MELVEPISFPFAGTLWLAVIPEGLRTLEKKALTVLLVEDSPDYAELVQDWLGAGSDEMSFVLNWTDTVSAGLKRLAAGGVDVILLDLGLPDSNGAPTFAKIRAQAPEIPVIVLSAGDSESLALQLIREGAEDYLVKNTCTSVALIRAVRYAFLRHGSQASKSRMSALPSDQGRVAGVIGAKGGLGTTTIAYNLAAELRLQTEEKVLLGDLDIQAGQVSFLAGIEPQYSFLNAVENKGRLDQSFWEALVNEGPFGLHIMSSPNLLGNKELDADALIAVLKVATPLYKWTVLDLGRLDSLSMRVLEKVHEVFLVTSTAIGALYEAKRVIGALVNAQIDIDRIRLIVNQFDRSFSGSELNSIFGIPVYATLPADDEEIQKACIDRTLPSESSQFRKQMVKLARKVAGLSEKKAKGTLGPLFPFASKFRRPDANAR